MNTAEKILQSIQKDGRATPFELSQKFQVSRSYTHRVLTGLMMAEKIRKVGQSPRVFYLPSTLDKKDFTQAFDAEIGQFIEKNYLYIAPNGEMLFGLLGFMTWVEKNKQQKEIYALAREYVHTTRQTHQLINKNGWIDATAKIKATFGKQTAIDEVIFEDFYALPKFGKTKLGQIVFHAKQAQNIKLMQKVAEQARPILIQIIKKYQINQVAFIPHTLPRKIAFIPEIRKIWKLDLPEIKLKKIYSGEILIPQKSLNKLNERVENARETIFITQQTKQQHEQRVLLIDDAVGSGATFNEVAKELKRTKMAKKVFGFAFIGSFKDFDVIREV